MHTAKIVLVLLISTAAPTLCFSQARSFDGVTCKNDIAKALLRHYLLPDERVVVTEAKYKGIALKNLWGYGEPPEPYRLQAWSICGRAHVLLLDLKHIVRDVVAAPPSRPQDSAALATCVADGQKYPEAVLFVRENLTSAYPHPRFRVEHAWSIDIKKLTFTPLKAGGIDCE